MGFRSKEAHQLCVRGCTLHLFEYVQQPTAVCWTFGTTESKEENPLCSHCEEG